MLLLLCFAGLQPEVAKRPVMAARSKVFIQLQEIEWLREEVTERGGAGQRRSS